MLSIRPQELKYLAAAKAIQEVLLEGDPDTGFEAFVKAGGKIFVLNKVRGHHRTFVSLNTAISYFYGLGIPEVIVSRGEANESD